MSDTSAKTDREGLSQAEIDELVAASDTGGRHLQGPVAWLLLGTAIAWSLFQLWLASPLPFMLNWGVLNDTEARSIHLAFAIFLAFTLYPSTRSPVLLTIGVGVALLMGGLFIYGARDDLPEWAVVAIVLPIIAAIILGSPKNWIAPWEWVLAIAGAAAALYLIIFYDEISDRVGAPIAQDLVVSIIGLVLLLEAARRALGPAMTIVASVFLLYTFLGPYMPSIIAHKGNALTEVANHHWITTEGVFGIALGVSTSFVFLFVLFGSLLDKAGAGNYFIQVAFSLMGHMRGGPAKAAVVSSAMTGLISGSSIANVVTTGTFTIPLMKKVGFSSEKAGAVEVASSVNGQIMPPVMGAAAFLMAVYVNIPYFDVVKHAFLPAVISYIALVYIVHLEAMKAGLKGMERSYEPSPLMKRLIAFAFGVAALCALSFGVYYGMGWIREVFPDTAGYIVFGILTAAYVALLWLSTKHPTPQMEDLEKPGAKLPRPGPTVKSGLHYVLPVVVLVWALMVDRLSPGLSAFWATAFMIFILVTQRPLGAILAGKGSELASEIKAGVVDLVGGLEAGARNMVGIGIATAAAGIIVGAVSQTGVGSALAEVVEVISGGNMIAILVLTAFLSLILGMGLPTTANYIVVQALLAPVIVTLGQQNGLLVPLIAVHLFVFYFGIMADVTPPVGLASFAAAAVSGGDALRTGAVAFFYSLRTAALPFLFMYNTELLLIAGRLPDGSWETVSWFQGIFVFIVATVAMLLFAAATQGWFIARNKIWETALLLLVAFSLFRPGYWMDQIVPPYVERAPAEIYEAAQNTEPNDFLRIEIAGVNDVGDPIEFVALLPIGAEETGEDRLLAAGLELVENDGKLIVDFAEGAAAEAGFDWDQEILKVLRPVEQPTKYLIYIPALALLALIILMQRRRAAASRPAGSEAPIGA